MTEQLIGSAGDQGGRHDGWLSARALKSLGTGNLMEKTWQTWHTESARFCPFEVMNKSVGRKFACLILWDMMAYKFTRFNQFLNHIQGINAKTLSARLRELLRNGLITRTVIQSSPVAVEYQLTKAGWELRPLLDQLVAFAVQHLPDDVEAATKAGTRSETAEVKHRFNY